MTSSIYFLIVLSLLYTFTECVSAKHVENIVHFEMEEMTMQNVKRVKLLQFSYKQCSGMPQGTMIIKSLNFDPDPLVFPGRMTVSFYVENDMTVSSNLAANVTLIKKTSFGNTTLPCLGFIGSCNYDDICSLIKPPICPKAFVDAKIPCHCPFPKGVYDLRKGATFDVLTEVFPPGEYFARLNLTMTGKHPVFVACYELAVTFG